MSRAARGTKPGTLTPRDEKYIENRAKGIGRDQSALMAGFPDYKGTGKDVEAKEVVRERLEEVRKVLAERHKITQDQVIEGYLDSINMAKIIGDPAAVRQGWAEIAKMLGLNAPETKKIEHTHSGQVNVATLEALPDHELLKLANGRIIEGVSTRVEDSEPADPAPSD